MMFPFDGVCEQIVRALEDRNWTVPDISVEFDVYGSGEQKYRMVRTVTGEDFRLYFGRPQARHGSWNDTAAISQINIPLLELSVYDDESGPTLATYVGNDWDADKVEFVSSSKINSKLSGERRLYLKYRATCHCGSTRGARFPGIGMLMDPLAQAALGHTHEGRRSPLLVADNDLGREYDAEAGDAVTLRTDDVYNDVATWR